jgi:hypothetical protein
MLDWPPRSQTCRSHIHATNNSGVLSQPNGVQPGVEKACFARPALFTATCRNRRHEKAHLKLNILVLERLYVETDGRCCADWLVQLQADCEHAPIPSLQAQTAESGHQKPSQQRRSFPMH